MENTIGELSINEKLHIAFVLSNKIADYEDAGINIRALCSSELYDDIYGYADGLVARYFDNIENGRCSLKAMRDFDPQEAENKIDSFISDCNNIIKAIQHNIQHIEK